MVKSSHDLMQLNDIIIGSKLQVEIILEICERSQRSYFIRGQVCSPGAEHPYTYTHHLHKGTWGLQKHLTKIIPRAR
jgi:hypothetical protein